MGQIHAHVDVYGQVQGVGFRYMTELKAKELGVKGYVKNRIDGSVETEIEGDAEKVYALIDLIKAGISPRAHVTHTDVTISETLEGYKQFRTAN